ncbi:MAG: SEL1-like repeat protein, partial [Gammaproteobacteria bacterium]|nr:SEL1-like repeat protein [Gammaproteobacteria bacterium]
LLRDGTGVPRDPVEAYKWLELAIPKLKPSPARESWVKMRQQLAQSMTPAQIA